VAINQMVDITLTNKRQNISQPACDTDVSITRLRYYTRVLGTILLFLGE